MGSVTANHYPLRSSVHQPSRHRLARCVLGKCARSFKHVLRCVRVVRSFDSELNTYRLILLDLPCDRIRYALNSHHCSLIASLAALVASAIALASRSRITLLSAITITAATVLMSFRNARRTCVYVARTRWCTGPQRAHLRDRCSRLLTTPRHAELQWSYEHDARPPEQTRSP